MVTESDTELVRRRFALGQQWPTVDPFLFVAHHDDRYPAATTDLRPAASLDGRRIGMDFEQIDGWNMYHGSTVPGFPQHPHRGFETITHVRAGVIDHADSLGATARFGAGDTQWMTAGSGIVHAEMFPLLATDRPNPLQLFQIWLNLPAADKLVDPYFTMLWHERTPRARLEAGPASVAEVTVIAGTLAIAGRQPVEPLAPPPDSWASRPEADVAIWHVAVTGDAELDLPGAAGSDTRRTVYAFGGTTLTIASTDDARPPSELPAGTGAEIGADRPVRLGAAGGSAQCLLLQGRPIGEPVVQYGPFVMNDRAGIAQAVDDYQRTGFGGWPWPTDDPVHERTAGRFARHADGRVEQMS